LSGARTSIPASLACASASDSFGQPQTEECGASNVCLDDTTIRKECSNVPIYKNVSMSLPLTPVASGKPTFNSMYSSNNDNNSKNVKSNLCELLKSETINTGELHNLRMQYIETKIAAQNAKKEYYLAKRAKLNCSKFDC